MGDHEFELHFVALGGSEVARLVRPESALYHDVFADVAFIFGVPRVNLRLLTVAGNLVDFFQRGSLIQWLENAELHSGHEQVADEQVADCVVTYALALRPAVLRRVKRALTR